MWLALSIGLAAVVKVALGPAHEADEHRRDLLAIQLGIVVLIERRASPARRREAGYASELPSVHRINDVQYGLGRHRTVSQPAPDR